MQNDDYKIIDKSDKLNVGYHTRCFNAFKIVEIFSVHWQLELLKLCRLLIQFK